jgi:hypothetical protein
MTRPLAEGFQTNWILINDIKSRSRIPKVANAVSEVHIRYGMSSANETFHVVKDDALWYLQGNSSIFLKANLILIKRFRKSKIDEILELSLCEAFVSQEERMAILSVHSFDRSSPGDVPPASIAK